MTPFPNQSEIDNLLFLLVEDALDQDSIAYIETWLSSGPDAQKYYCDFVNDYIAMKHQVNALIEMDEDAFSVSSEFDRELWSALADMEQAAPAIEILTPEPVKLIEKVVYPPRPKYTIHKSTIASLIAGVAAVLFILLFAKFAPVNNYSHEVATLVDQVNAVWSDSDTELKTGSRLWTHEAPLQLDRGIVKLHYDEGVDVVIEGPAFFKIERVGLHLEYGRLFSCVSETGIGFTVTTPKSQFVDHGTQFCVQADINGSSELHVIKGKVQMFAGSKGVAKAAQMVLGNEAVQYDARRDRIRSIPLESKAFVRHIDSATGFIWKGQPLSLADVVGGGNGFGTGQLNQEIRLADHEAHKTTDAVVYQTIESHPYLDGGFIPDGRGGPIQVSSAGHLFQECPATNGMYWAGIFNGAWHAIGPADVADHYLRLDGKEYGTMENPAIYIHASQGITFDLDAIRRDQPDFDVTRFTAKAGLSQSLLDYSERFPSTDSRALPKADFYVLVDGTVRFQSLGRSPSDDAIDIHVDLSTDDRFLTLMTAEGPDGGNKYDWTLFAEPFLQCNVRDN